MADDEFEKWWSRCHPWDWYAKEQSGRPISTKARLHIWQLCRAAWLREDLPQRSDSTAEGK
jgi:hypothetical protein